ncbi:MAG: molybdenum cofactor biosynthesis protein B [Capsulimonadaceae bacterium]
MEHVDTTAVEGTAPEPKPIRVAVLTVSDRCAGGKQVDQSGPAIQAELPVGEFLVVLYAIVPDERKSITDTLKRWCDDDKCDIVLTTGGTGFGPRDITPEATRRVIERESSNITQYLLIKGTADNPLAALSRGVAGVRRQTLIVNLPGSPDGARHGTQCLRPLLPHAVDVLRGTEKGHPTP